MVDDPTCVLVSRRSTSYPHIPIHLLLKQRLTSQVVDDHGFQLSTDRVLNLEELKAYLRTVAKFLRVQELAGIERALDQRDRESQESLDRPLGRMQVTPDTSVFCSL